MFQSLPSDFPFLLRHPLHSATNSVTTALTNGWKTQHQSFANQCGHGAPGPNEQAAVPAPLG